MSGASGAARSLPLVLVVEDFDELYELYSDFLAGAGFAVEGSSTGEQAIEEARRLVPDIIIMDLGLPRMNGWEAIQLIKSEPATSHIPVLALTGHVQQRFAELARQAGADRVLLKPCPLSELLSELWRLLKREADAHP
jgi:two-component system cell cycle response regulator DivK